MGCVEVVSELVRRNIVRTSSSSARPSDSPADMSPLQMAPWYEMPTISPSRLRPVIRCSDTETLWEEVAAPILPELTQQLVGRVEVSGSVADVGDTVSGGERDLDSDLARENAVDDIHARDDRALRISRRPAANSESATIPGHQPLRTVLRRSAAEVRWRGQRPPRLEMRLRTAVGARTGLGGGSRLPSDRQMPSASSVAQNPVPTVMRASGEAIHDRRRLDSGCGCTSASPTSPTGSIAYELWPSNTMPRQPAPVRVTRTHEPARPSTVPCIGWMSERPLVPPGPDVLVGSQAQLELLAEGARGSGAAGLRRAQRSLDPNELRD